MNPLAVVRKAMACGWIKVAGPDPETERQKQERRKKRKRERERKYYRQRAKQWRRAGLTSRGKPWVRQCQWHPELRGLSPGEYKRRWRKQQRAAFIAAGLNNKGKPRQRRTWPELRGLSGRAYRKAYLKLWRALNWGSAPDRKPGSHPRLPRSTAGRAR